MLTRGRQIQIILLHEVSLKIRLKYIVKVFKMKLPPADTVTCPAKGPQELTDKDRSRKELYIMLLPFFLGWKNVSVQQLYVYHHIVGFRNEGVYGASSTLVNDESLQASPAY